MPIELVEDHYLLAQRMLLEQFKNKPAIADLVGCLAFYFDEIESDLDQMRRQRTVISEAVGAQLDGLGDILVLPRAGRSDAAYRVALEAEILLHSSAGTRDQLITLTGERVSIAEFAAGDGHGAEFVATNRDAGAGTPLVLITAAEAREIFRLLNRGRSAAVYFTFEYGADDSAARFKFDTAGRTFDGPSIFGVGTGSPTSPVE